jgi:fructose-1,6-bisphosphatase I
VRDGFRRVEGIIPIPDGGKRGRYVLMFDPLDGSRTSTSTPASERSFPFIERSRPRPGRQREDCLQCGTEQLAAGYFIYGSSTMMVYTTGHGVNGFTLDPSLGEFLLSHENIRIPKRGRIYSINEGNINQWDAPTLRYVTHVKQENKAEGRPYSLRYIGSLVADFHRNLLKGGIFLYPGLKGNYSSLRSLTLAMVVEQAGGSASTGSQRILDVVPQSLHQRVPLIIGSTDDVRLYEKFCREAVAAKASEPVRH